MHWQPPPPQLIGPRLKDGRCHNLSSRQVERRATPLLPGAQWMDDSLLHPASPHALSSLRPADSQGVFTRWVTKWGRGRIQLDQFYQRTETNADGAKIVVFLLPPPPAVLVLLDINRQVVEEVLTVFSLKSRKQTGVTLKVTLQRNHVKKLFLLLVCMTKIFPSFLGLPALLCHWPASGAFPFLSGSRSQVSCGLTPG